LPPYFYGFVEKLSSEGASLLILTSHLWRQNLFDKENIGFCLMAWGLLLIPLASPPVLKIKKNYLSMIIANNRSGSAYFEQEINA
jgi:hypothetical protein